MIGEEVIAYYGDAGDGEELFEKSKLVRCKDCMFYTPLDESRPFDCSIGLLNAMPTDYCSYGERIDNE